MRPVRYIVSSLCLPAPEAAPGCQPRCPCCAARCSQRLLQFLVPGWSLRGMLGQGQPPEPIAACAPQSPSCGPGACEGGGQRAPAARQGWGLSPEPLTMPPNTDYCHQHRPTRAPDGARGCSIPQGNTEGPEAKGTWPGPTWGSAGLSPQTRVMSDGVRGDGSHLYVLRAVGLCPSLTWSTHLVTSHRGWWQKAGEGHPPPGRAVRWVLESPGWSRSSSS